MSGLLIFLITILILILSVTISATAFYLLLRMVEHAVALLERISHGR